MLTPSYSELMEIIKQGDKLDNRVTSRYTVVLAAAKRARQITDGANPLSYAPTDRAVSIAVTEMSEAKLRINVDESLLESGYERVIRSQNRYRSISVVSKDDLNEDLKQDYTPSNYTLEDDAEDPYAAEAIEEQITPAIEEEEISDELYVDEEMPDEITDMEEPDEIEEIE